MTEPIRASRPLGATRAPQAASTGPIAPAPPAPVPPAPVSSADANATAERAQAALAQLQKAQDTLRQALEKNDLPAARRALQDGLKAAGAQQDGPYGATFKAAREAFEQVGSQLDAAAAKPAPAPKPKKKGLFGFIGDALGKVGNAIGGAVDFVFKPVRNAVEKVLKPVGDMLSGLKKTIDNTLGKIPILGSAVRFTTGLAASVGGIVTGVGQAILNPVATVKGLGTLAWNLMPPPVPKMLYDVLVNGKTPAESLKDQGQNLLGFGKAMFSGALSDIKDGNYAGALGRLTGDIGSFAVGGVGAARAASWAGKLGRFEKVAQVGIKALSADQVLIEGAVKGARALKGAGKAEAIAADAGKAVGKGEALAHDAAKLDGAATATARAAEAPAGIGDFFRNLFGGKKQAHGTLAPQPWDGVHRLWDSQGWGGRAAANKPLVEAAAHRRWAAAGPAEQARFNALFQQAGTDAERVMLTRAYATRNALPHIEELASDLRGVAAGHYAHLGITDPASIQALNRLTPDQRVLNVATLEGHQQFFSTSCNPTSAQIVRAELDPVYAVAARRNPQMLINEQKWLLETNQGVAVPRGWDHARQGVGTWPDQIAPELSARTPGWRFDAVDLSGRASMRTTPAQRAAAVQELGHIIEQGGPSEIFVRWIQNGQPAGGHAIAVVDTRVLPNGQRQFLLHDPESVDLPYRTGNTHWVDASDIVAGHLGPGYNYMGELEAYFRSTPDTPLVPGAAR